MGDLKNNKSEMVLSIIVAIETIGLGVLGYLYWKEKSANAPVVKPATTAS